VNEALVIYRTGPFTWNTTHPGVLHWTPDDRIALHLLNEGETPPTPEFDVAVAEIRRVGGALPYLTFYLPMKTYRLQLAGHPAASSGAGGWASRLRGAGVPVRYLNGAKFGALTLGITAAIIALSVALILLVG
jgi:hypothetical protein